MFSSTAPAAEIELRGGPQLHVPATFEGSIVVIPVGHEQFRFPKSEVRLISSGGLPADEWPSRRQAAMRGTPRDQFAAAWWALENGLTAEAEATFRASHANDPSLATAARVVAILDRLSAPVPPPDPARFESLRPLNLRRTESDHFVLLHRLPGENASERLALMERVHSTYYVTFAGLGFDLRTPREKLVAACFSAEDDYGDFLRKSDAGELVDTRGYYHPTLHLVVTFDTSPGRLDLSDRESLLRELDRRRVEFGALAHEIVHQLVAESRLAPHYDAFPAWLHEGLAMQFETVRDGRWTGLATVNDTRLSHWLACRPLPRLAPLLHDTGFRHGYNSDHYAQAWSFVAFLRTQHPSAFVSLLDSARLPSSLTPAERADHVTRSLLEATGLDLLSLEQGWRSYVRTLGQPAVSSLPRNP